MGNCAVLGQLNQEEAIPMIFLDEETWQLEIEIPLRGKTTQLQYKYVLKNQDGSLRSEWGNDRVITLTSSTSSCVLYDTWNHAGDFENAFFTTPFQEVLLPKHKFVSKKSVTGSHTFRVKAPLLLAHQQVCLLGDVASLHNWSTAAPIYYRKRRIGGKLL